jgi:mono/diheme cytochrome c family protein
LVASVLLAAGSLQQSDPSSGKAMFTSYCAACHGAEGKGNGPAASELKVAPADLTQLAKSNNGKYPADHVRAILEFGAKAPAHGRATCPYGALYFARWTRPTL